MAKNRRRGRPLGTGQYTPQETAQRLAYNRMRAQCKFRNEQFDLTLEQFLEVWEGVWHHRGKEPHQLCISRQDPEGAWDLHNTIIITRESHFKKTGKNIRDCVHQPYNIWDIKQ